MIGRKVDAGIPLGRSNSGYRNQLEKKRNRQIQVTISGSYNKYLDEVRQAIKEFKQYRANILSPASGYEDDNKNGFSTLAGDPSLVPTVTEARHLDAISKSDLLWLIAPDGFTGFATTLEIGYAYALDTPIFTSDTLKEPILREYVQKVENPKDAVLRVVQDSTNVMTTVLLNPVEAINVIKSQLIELEKLMSWDEKPMGVMKSQRAREITQIIAKTLKMLGNLAKGKMG